MKSNARKKATKPAVAAKTKTRRTSTRPGGTELLQTAAALGLKLYAVEGLTNFRRRAITSAERLTEAGTFDNLSDEDMILMLQFIRDKPDQIIVEIKRDLNVGPDEVFAVIDSFVHNIALDDAELTRLQAISEEKHRAAGYGEDESWPEDKRPDDIQTLFDAYWELYGQLKVAILRHHGEAEMADMLENDSDAYDARVETGKALMAEKHQTRGIPGQDK